MLSSQSTPMQASTAHCAPNNRTWGFSRNKYHGSTHRSLVTIFIGAIEQNVERLSYQFRGGGVKEYLPCGATGYEAFGNGGTATSRACHSCTSTRV